MKPRIKVLTLGVDDLERLLAKDSNVAASPPSPTDFSIGHNVASKQQVDDVMGQAKAAGAKITTPAHETFYGGYAGYFQDPDGHLWEVAWNQAWEVKDSPRHVVPSVR